MYKTKSNNNHRQYQKIIRQKIKNNAYKISKMIIINSAIYNSNKNKK